MIIVVDALNRDEFADLLDDMFKLRARVFGGRLGWEVDVTNGREIDQFDNLDPAYVIGLDDEGHVVSCVRALQTTGPHMLSDVFQTILDGEPPLRSSRIWESTRFCVDTQRLTRDGTMRGVSLATAELMVGSLEFCMSAGVTDIITVIDPVMNRVLIRSDNAPYDYVGSTKQMGKVPAMAALLDCTFERIERVRAFAGVTGDVFATDEQIAHIRALRAARAQGPVLAVNNVEKAFSPSDLTDYCQAQIATATTPAEISAARALVETLGRVSA